jgi:hypothetical protein
MMPTVDLIHADGDGAPLGAGQRSTGESSVDEYGVPAQPIAYRTAKRKR